MIPLKLSQIASMAGGRLAGPDREATGLCIDSRKVKKGELFVAIVGPNHDGHDFIAQALSAGAVGAVANENQAGHWAERHESGIILVPDTLKALHLFAKSYRAGFDIRMIAITGTNGKTTTKEMIARAAGGMFRLLKSQGNLNNQYGLPLSLSFLRPEHQVAVMEMGMSGFGEITTLCEMARPEIGIITTVSEGHTQFVGDVRGVARAKGELLECLPEDGTAILNADCDILMEQVGRSRARVITFGIDRPAEVRAETISTGADGVRFSVDGVGFELKLTGRHNVYNALAAIAACDRLGVPRLEASRQLAGMEAVPMRQEILKLKTITLINDAYNANPESVRAALENLKEIAGSGRKVAVLADMLELGEIGPQRHQEIGRLAAEAADLVVTIGCLATHINEGARSAGAEAVHFSDNARAMPFIIKAIRPGDTILVKGSRGMKLEEIVEALKERA